MAKKRKSVSYYNSIKVIRNEWKQSMPERCMWCEGSFPRIKLEVHEMERKSHARNRWWPEDACNGLVLCPHCHSEYFATMPHAKQLAVKLLEDPNHFNLQGWLEVGGRPDSYVTMEDIVEEVKELLL
jgi:hypothetical protein